MRDFYPTFFITLISAVFYLNFSGSRIAYAEEAPPQEAPKRNFQTEDYQAKTFRILMDQETHQESRSNNFFQQQQRLSLSNGRAKDITDRLQNTEIQSVTHQLSSRKDDFLSANPEAKTPATIIGVGAGLWFGHEVPITKNENFELRSSVEGRSKKASVGIASPTTNPLADSSSSRLDYTSGRLNLGIQHSFSALETGAEAFYQFQNQSFNIHLRRKIIDHLALTLGTEGDAGLWYQLNL